MDFDFVAIDFETARSSLDSACSVGVAAVKNLEIIDSAYSLLRPPTLDFSPRNTKVHGITPDMVEQAPTLDEFWAEISGMFSEHCPVVAHNAHFDMSALRLSTTAEIPNFPYVDSIQIAAPFVPGNRSLAHCAEVMQIDMGLHHNALDDAITCANIVIYGLKATNCVSLWEYLAQSDLYIHRFKDLIPQRYIADTKSSKPKFPRSVKISDIHSLPERALDPKHPLYQKNIVFTGDLSVSRKDAMQMAANVGAIIKSSVSRKTDYLVVGVQDCDIVGEDGLSGKQEMAIELNQSGKGHIVVLDESKFFALLRGEEGALSHA